MESEGVTNPSWRINKKKRKWIQVLRLDKKCKKLPRLTKIWVQLIAAAFTLVTFAINVG